MLRRRSLAKRADDRLDGRVPRCAIVVLVVQVDVLDCSPRCNAVVLAQFNEILGLSLVGTMGMMFLPTSMAYISSLMQNGR